MISRASEDASKHWNLAIHTHTHTHTQLLCYMLSRSSTCARTRVDASRDHFCVAVGFAVSPHTTEDLVGIQRALSHTGGGWIRFFFLDYTNFQPEEPPRFGTMKIIVSLTSAREGRVSSSQNTRGPFIAIILRTLFYKQ